MSSLLATLEVGEIAFRWDGNTRVFRADKLVVSVEPDMARAVLEGGTKVNTFLGVWLAFSVASDYMEGISGTAPDAVNVANALDTGPVRFYPIYDIDPSVYLDVIGNGERHEALNVSGGLFTPSAVLTFEAVERLPERPAWLRVTR